MTAAAQTCPCGGVATPGVATKAMSFEQCCGRYGPHAGAEPAPSAHLLMRSRYSAYTLGDEAYLRATWHASTCPREAIVNPEPGLKWLGLEVRRHTESQDGDSATVEFVARYRIKGRAHRLHEVSRFVREQGRWYYVDGSFPESIAAG